MQTLALHIPPAAPPVVHNLAPWTLRAWPTVLWQADTPPTGRLQHLGTRINFPGDRMVRTAGQTLWGGKLGSGNAGLAWDWVQIARGVVAIADPMSVVTNLRLLGDEGEVLTALEAARFLNSVVHDLPWQGEVARALSAGVN